LRVSNGFSCRFVDDAFLGLIVASGAIPCAPTLDTMPDPCDMDAEYLLGLNDYCPGARQMANGISPWVATSAEYRPDRYYTYDRLTELIRNWEKEYPSLVQVESIGTTYEGRNIWALTITNVETGHHSEKPASFVDANIHAGEVTGCATVLWLVNHLLTTYGED